MRTPIPPLDLLFYLIETHENPKHVGALMIFKKPANARADYMSELVDKLRRVPVAEPFNYRPVFSLLDRPQWEIVEEMEMEYHLRHSALPAPGSMAQLIEAVQRLHVGVLDRQRPGWICQVIEGLENDSFALYTKIHHAYIDGMSGVRRLYGTLSESPDNREIVPLWGFRSQPLAKQISRRESSVRNRLGDLASSALDKLKVVGELNGLLVDISEQLFNLKEKNGHIPFCAPRTRMNTPVRSDLRSIGVMTLPLDLIKALAHNAGCTVNDVVLTLTDAALLDYLKACKEPTDKPLVAMIPMSLREEGDESANTQVATLLVELGAPKMSLRQRLHKVASSAAGSKQEASEMSREALMDFVLMIGGAFELLQRTGLETSVPPSYNVLVSNVPGAKSKNLYMAGARLLATYPISTLTPGNNINVTVLSHGDSLDFGVVADHAAIPDIEPIIQGIQKNFDKLLELFEVNKQQTARKTKPVKKKPVKSKPVKSKPVKSKPVKSKPVKSQSVR